MDRPWRKLPAVLQFKVYMTPKQPNTNLKAPARSFTGFRARTKCLAWARFDDFPELVGIKARPADQSAANVGRR